MNYKIHYDRLIERAQNRSILPGIYFETHHIVPKCLGGLNDLANLVKLLPDEHFVAHQLLVKINPGNPKLIYAAHMMGNTRNGNKSYAWLREQFANVRSNTKHSAETREKMSRSHTGKPRPPMPDRTRIAIVKANLGKPSPLRGISRSSESVQKMKETNVDLYKSWSGKPMSSVQCPHCSKIGNRIVMHRWHFTNCKHYS